MKIVHLCLSNFYIDNYSYQENMLPKYHVLQGHEVTVIASLVSFDADGKPCLLEGESTHRTNDGFKVIRLDYRRPFYKLNRFIRIYNGLAKVLDAERPDLLFIHDFSFMDIRVVLKYARKNPAVSIFVDCHTDYINSARTWLSKHVFHHVVWRYFARRLNPLVKKYYGVTPLRCEFLRNAYRIPQQQIELLVMGVDDDALRKKDRAALREQLCVSRGIQASDFIITTGGKIDIQKNIHLVMQAVRELNRPGLKLIVFGPVAPEMRAVFEELLSSDAIIHIGWLNPDEILNLFMASDLVIFPGTHSVLWEQAVGVGVPCFFKHWAGMTHVDVGGNCEFLQEDNFIEVRDKVAALLDTPEKYRQMKVAAMERGLSAFSYSHIARRAIEQAA